MTALLHAVIVLTELTITFWTVLKFYIVLILHCVVIPSDLQQVDENFLLKFCVTFSVLYIMLSKMAMV